MKSGNTYRFTLSWPMETEEQVIAGEFLSKLGYKKSKFIIQLICDYITAHPEAMNPKETLKFIVNSTSLGVTLTEMIKSMIQSEFAGKMFVQPQIENPATEEVAPAVDESIEDMLGNLDMWNNQ